MIIAEGFLRLEKSISMSILMKEDVCNYRQINFLKKVMEQISLEATCWIIKNSEDNKKNESSCQGRNLHKRL